MLSSATGQPGGLASMAREDDIQVAERLTNIIATLAGLGTPDQRRGRSRDGKFVASPPCLEAQLELERALLSVARRVKAREQ